MPNLNKVMLMGNLTRDVELRYTPQGTALAEFSLAISRSWKGTDGEKKDEVTFVDCQAWARGAEVISQYTKKGAPLYVEGRLKLEQWEGKDGQKRSRMRVVVESFQFLGSKPSAERAEAGAHREEPPKPEAARPSEPPPAYPPSENIPF